MTESGITERTAVLAPKLLPAVACICLAACGGDTTSGVDDQPEPNPRPAAAPPRPQPMQMEDADTDDSGDLSEEEFVAYHTVRMKRFFESLDKDGDGKLSAGELSRIQRSGTGVRPGPGENPDRERPAPVRPKPPTGEGKGAP